MKLPNVMVAVLASAGVMLAQTGQPAASRPSQDHMRSQIKNLDHESFEVRTKAMDELRAAGEAARADLETARSSPSLEVRTRAEALLKDLDAAKTASRSDLRPLAPEADPAQRPRGSNVRPRAQDFDDPRAFAEALRKHVADLERAMGRTELRLPEELWIEQAIVPDVQWDLGTTFTVAETRDGETVTMKSGSDGVRVSVKRKNEAGEQIVESWSAPSLEEFKTQHPDVWAKHGHLASGGRFRTSILTVPRPQLAPPPPIAPSPGDPVTPVPVPMTGVGRLGVYASPPPAVLDRHLKLNGSGLVIDDVEPRSLAVRLGIQALDVLLEIDGQKVRTRDDIGKAMNRKDAPATIAVKLLREGEIKEFSASR
jgi:hypothetical protein